jgi:hypothetical protein
MPPGRRTMRSLETAGTFVAAWWTDSCAACAARFELLFIRCDQHDHRLDLAARY